MKKVLFMLLVGALLATPMFADARPATPECSEGTHYVGKYKCVDRQATDECLKWGECSVWSTPECNSWSETECNGWDEPQCSEYGQAECTQTDWVCTNQKWWGCANWDKQCVAWSEKPCLDWTKPACNSWTEAQCLEYGESTCEQYECTKYKKECAEKAWVGECVADDVPEPEEPEEPTCEDGYTMRNGTCSADAVGGSWVTRLPKVSSKAFVQDSCVNFLASNRSIGGILVGTESSQFPLDTYRKPYIDPIGWPVCSTELLGYEQRFENQEPAVFHSICPDLDGCFYVRPYMSSYFNGQPDYGNIYGDEQYVCFN